MVSNLDKLENYINITLDENIKNVEKFKSDGWVVCRYDEFEHFIKLIKNDINDYIKTEREQKIEYKE